MFYFIYPIVFYIFSCCIKRCALGYQCSIIQSYIERFLLYIGVCGGLCGILFCFVILILMIARDNKFNIVNWMNEDNDDLERVWCMIIGTILLICSLSVFCLPHCRKRCGLMIRVKKILKWRDVIMDEERDEFGHALMGMGRVSSMGQSVDLTAARRQRTDTETSSVIKVNPQSPLLKPEHT